MKFRSVTLVWVLFVAACGDCSSGAEPFEFEEDAVGSGSWSDAAGRDGGLAIDHDRIDPRILDRCADDLECICLGLEVGACDAVDSCGEQTATQVVEGECRRGVSVRCMPVQNCNNNAPYVRGPDGTCWQFGSGGACIPPKFDDSEEGTEGCEAEVQAACSE